MPSAIVTLPDGRKAKVSADSRDAVVAKAKELAGQLQPPPVASPLASPSVDVLSPEFRRQEMAGESAFGANFGRSALSQFLNNAIGVPNLIATAGGRMLLGLPLVDRPAPLPAGVDPRINQPLIDMPKVGERVLPLPTGAQVVAGVETAAQIPGALANSEPLNLGQRFQEQIASDQAAATEHPIAAGLGATAGDIATLLTGRAGIRNALRPPPGSLVPVKTGRSAAPGFRRALDEIVSSKFAKNLGRGVGRAAETGLEGASLALLDEGDPLKTAAYAAGGQAAGSLMLSMLNGVRRRSLPATFMTLIVGNQLFRTIGPGKRDMFEASDKALDEIIAGFGLGALAGMAGAGRIPRSGFAGNFPAMFTDALTAIPRGSLVSLMQDMTKAAEDKNDAALTVMNRMASNPDAFGPGARVRVERAIKSGKEGAVLKEIDSLLKNKAFRDKLDEGG